MNLHNPGLKLYLVVIKVLREALHLMAAQPTSCRFEPVCSVYFSQAVKEWGMVRGSYMGVTRICRCFPGSRSGVDLVPRKEVI